MCVCVFVLYVCGVFFVCVTDVYIIVILCLCVCVCIVVCSLAQGGLYCESILFIQHLCFT